MKRTHRLRWQAAAVVTVAALSVAACSSGSSSSSELRIRLEQLQCRADRVRARHHPDSDHYRQPPAADRAGRAWLQRDRARLGRVLRLRQRPRRRERPQDRLQVPQRRLQPDHDGVGGAPAGAAGQRVRRCSTASARPRTWPRSASSTRRRCPDVFVASGCECWNDPTKYPQTFGWQLDYIREGKILGQYVKQHFAGKKVGFFYQNDEFGQDGVKGLLDEIPASMVVSKQTYDPTNTNIGPAVAALRAIRRPGRRLVLHPGVHRAAQAELAQAGLQPDAGGQQRRLRPDHPGRAAGGVRQAGRREGQRQPAHQRDHHRRVPARPRRHRQQLDHAVQEGARPVRRRRRRSTATCCTARPSATRSCRPCSRRAATPPGRTWSRRSRTGMPQGPAVAPYAYSSSDHKGVTGAYMGVIQNGQLVQQGPVLTTDDVRVQVPSPHTRDPSSRRRRVAYRHPDVASAIPD